MKRSKGDWSETSVRSYIITARPQKREKFASVCV
jgi:hypothetical protein